MGSGYSGPDRRKRRMYVTHNTEYHLHDGVCVAVRDKHTVLAGRIRADELAIPSSFVC